MLVANNEFELERVLRGIDISVPSRPKGRTKDHTERYAIAHMLSALIGKGRLSFPLELIRRERPDFLLRVSNKEIGIEHTEAVPQNEAHKAVLRDEVNGPKTYFITHHTPSEPKRTRKDLTQEIEANRMGSGWAGDSVEREWADAMFYFIKDKMGIFMKGGFEKFMQNWLLIYDNWSLPDLHVEEATPFLFDLAKKNSCFDKFDCIYIITGSFVCEFTKTGIKQYETVNLWA